MKNKFPNIYLAMWQVYLLQGLLYSEGGLLSQSLLVLLLLISLYYFVYANLHYNLCKPMRILSVMIVIWTIYGIIPMIYGSGQLSLSVATFTYIKNIYMSLLPIYAIYVFVKNGTLTENMLQRWLVVFIVVAIACFYKSQYQLQFVANERGYKEEEYTNNAGYIIVGILPLIPLFWRKPFWQYIFLGVCMLYVLMGYKRGAIISGTLCSVWMIYASLKNERNSNFGVNKRRVSRLVLTLIVIVAAVFVVQYLMSTSDYFNSRVESTRHGYTSNRNDLYGFFLSYFLHNMSPLDYLVGLGANGTLKIYYNVAHNDWLEIAIDNGAIMLMLYFAYWHSMLKMFIRGNNRNMSNMMFGMFVIIYLFKSFFSFSYSDVPIYSACAIGYAFATYMPKMNKSSNTQ